MVRTPPPPNSNKKGEPPSLGQIKDNLALPDSNQIISLNFRVTADFKRDFKVAAATRGITQSELLTQAFAQWQRKYE